MVSCIFSLNQSSEFQYPFLFVYILEFPQRFSRFFQPWIQSMSHPPQLHPSNRSRRKKQTWPDQCPAGLCERDWLVCTSLWFSHKNWVFDFSKTTACRPGQYTVLFSPVAMMFGCGIAQQRFPTVLQKDGSLMMFSHQKNKTVSASLGVAICAMVILPMPIPNIMANYQ